MIDTNIILEIKGLLASSETQKNSYIRAVILAQQVGDLLKCIRYIDCYPEHADGYRAELKISLSDLIIQAFAICKLYGLDVDQVIDLGAARLSEFRKKQGFKE